MVFLFKKHAFPFMLLAALGLAVIFPEGASEEGILHGKWLTKLGVAVIFFLQGMSLSARSLAAGYRPLRLHVFVLSWNFLWFPVVTALLLYPMSRFLSTELVLGFGLLAILPTTIASATAFTAISGGSTAQAIFSTILSNLLAVIIVPIVSVAYLQGKTAMQIPLGTVLLSLFCLLVLPLVIGQVVRWLTHLNGNYIAKVTRTASGGIIALIVYVAFAQGINSGFLEKLSFQAFGAVLGSVILLLLVTSVLVWKSMFCLQLEFPQKIAAFFCASQKSLATGLPILSSVLIVVPEIESAAMIFVPLLCFHPLQMLLAGVVADRFIKKHSLN